MQRHKHIVNTADIEWQSGGNGARFQFQRKWLTPEVSADRLGCSLYRVEPGKTAYPHHRHFANEEAIYVLEGKGRLRLDDAEFELGPGDYIALPPAGPAHQLIGGDDGALVYLCLSTMLHPDLVEYPDSNKIGAYAGSGPGGDKSVRRVNALFRSESEVDYYDRE